MKKILVGSLFVLALAWLVWLATTGVEENPTTAENVAAEPAKPATPTITLIDIAPQTGLVDDTKTWSAEVADFNNDQRPDILVVRHNPEPETLYINSVSGFVARDIGLPADRHHCTAGDVNLDGRMDSFCSVGAARGESAGENNLYLQQADGSYSDLAAQYGVTDQYGRGRWSVFLNANGDAWPDLFLGNRPGRTDEHISSNRLYINDGGKDFVESPSFGINLPIGARCSVVTDFNTDGLDDLLICSEQELKLYVNQNGTHFEDASESINARRHWRRALLADINGDAAPDLVTLRGDRLAVHYRKGNRFPELNFTVDLENGMDVAAADADGDGDNDLFVVQSGCIGIAGTEPIEQLNVRNDFLLLNNGHGQLTQVSASHLRPAQGCGGQVLPIDYDSDGRSEFLILNGYSRSKGPLQLIQLEQR